MFVLDTSAWIEYFEDTHIGKRIAGLLLTGRCYTSVTTIAEIASYAAKRGIDPSTTIDKVDTVSTIISADRNIAETAGGLNLERKKVSKKWGMMDSFVLATSIWKGLKILTKDRDFEGLDNVELL